LDFCKETFPWNVIQMREVLHQVLVAGPEDSELLSRIHLEVADLVLV